MDAGAASSEVYYTNAQIPQQMILPGQMPLSPSYAPAAPSAAPSSTSLGESVCNVWKSNLDYHFSLMRHYILTYNFLTVDVKFPGVVARPIGTFHTTAEFHYQTLRANIDLVDPIQLGITLTDANGNVPPGINHLGTWQFNFKFDEAESMYSVEGLEVLKQSGVDLDRHAAEGIDIDEFFALLTTSGFVLNPNVTWITFYSGYDLGLIISKVTNRGVPTERDEYLKLVKLHFPQVWDVKLLVKAFNLSAKSYLHEIAEDFQLFRGTPFCGAGADSRLAALCFYEIMRSLGDHALVIKNRLFGLEEDTTPADDDARAQQAQAQAQVQQVQAQAQAHAAVAQAQAHAAAQSHAAQGHAAQGHAAPAYASGVQMMQMAPYMMSSSNPQAGSRTPLFFGPR